MPLLRVTQTVALQGQATAPSSKSHSIRGLIFDLLAKGESILINSLASDDLTDALSVCRDLGALISVIDQKLIIQSTGLAFSNAPAHLNTGNSGITTRFTLPLLGLRQNTSTPINVFCGEQMRGRLIRPLIDALRVLGLNIDYNVRDGLFPLTITGQLHGGETEIDGLTSQYLSALLIALPCAAQNSIITVRSLHERPYIDMTLNWLTQ